MSVGREPGQNPEIKSKPAFQTFYVHDSANRRLSEMIASLYAPVLEQFNQSILSMHKPMLEQISKTLISIHEPMLEQVNKSLSSLLKPYLESILRDVSESFAASYQLQIAGLFRQFSESMQLLDWSNLANRKLPLSLHITALGNPMAVQVAGIIKGSTASANHFEVNDKSSQRSRGSDRESAAMLTVVVFLVVYIALSFAVTHTPEMARLMMVDGPTPFEAAMGAGAFTFWSATRCSDDSSSSDA